MPTFIKRNLFSRTVAHPGDGGAGSAAITLAALMRLEGWGTQSLTATNVSDPNNPIGTAKSLDSFQGDGGTLIPQTADVYVGDDEFVADAAAVGPPRLYRGSKAVAGQPFSLNDYFRAPIDANDVSIYSVAQNIEIIFEGF